MNTENSNAKAGKNRIISVMTPILGTAALFLGMFIDGASYKVFWAAAAFVLCFAFVYAFYAETYRSDIVSDIPRAVLTAAVPAVCFFAVWLPYEALVSSLLLAAITLLAVYADLTLSMFVLAAVTGFCALFTPGKLAGIAVLLGLILLICILSEKLRDIQTLIFAAIICILFFAILTIAANGFVLHDAFGTNEIVVFVISTMILTCVYFIKILRSDLEETSAAEAAKTPTEHDNKVLKRELDSRKKQNEKLMASNKESQDTVDRMKQEYIELESKNSELKSRIEELMNKTVAVEEAVSPEFRYVKDLSKNSKIYKHCLQIARISSDASELIGCDAQMGYAVGLYHEASKVLGEDYAAKLKDVYRLPEYLIRQIVHIKDKNNNLPIIREAGIVLLCDDIINTANYLSKNNNETVPMERIVSNAIKVRKEQNVLRLAGFSNEEIQLLKLYFIDKGANYDSAD
ncbi:MAG: hypothetical protein IK001_02535 [Lachnospiraceae bacterium]|nr:hypothetical protein [Lachnospiraceae bacterium]